VRIDIILEKAGISVAIYFAHKFQIMPSQCQMEVSEALAYAASKYRSHVDDAEEGLI
jgi:hypothetical protein